MDVIYTMAPLAAEDTSAPPPKLISLGGVNVYAQAQSDGRYQVVQLLSTDPADFLRPELAPGRVINL